MAPRANWKGFLKIAELTCPIALYTAVSTSERVAFHTLNRKTGHRVRRQFVDQETGRLVEPADQVKGYEVGKDDFVVLEPEEIAAAFPDSDKTIDIERFIACSDIDDVYFDRPYYLGPADPVAQNAFGVIRDGMRSEKVAALARTVLFRRVRTLLIRAQWQRDDRHAPEFRLRGQTAPRRVRGGAEAKDHGRDARSRQAHHSHQAGQVRPEKVR